MPVSNVFLYRMPAGIPGAVNRELAAVSEPNQLDVTNPPTAYGDPVKMGSNGKIQALASGDTTAAIYGFLERPYPTQAGYGSAQGYGQTAPIPGTRCTVMKSGYMCVAVQGATAPSPGSAVFVRVAGTVPTGGRIDGLEAVADGTPANTPQIGTQNTTYFRGAGDGNGNTEIAFNI
jgi:hypothetical protein